MLVCSAALAQNAAAQQPCARPNWVDAYVPGWAQEESAQFQDGEFESVTDLLHFAVFIRRNGTLDLRSNELAPDRMRELVAHAHQGGRKALLVVGGESAARGLRAATSPARLHHTIRALAELVERYDYDGIDLDWEPFPTRNAQRYRDAVKALRAGLDAIAARRGRPAVLTSAIQVDVNDGRYMRALTRNLAAVAQSLDQINLMTYTMADPKELHFVWHNSALYPAKSSPLRGFRSPNADDAVQAFLHAGFRPEQLGIGVNLHGYLWRSRHRSTREDLSRPGAIWRRRPRVIEFSYDEVMSKFYRADRYRWDREAQVPYLSIRETHSLISYEDERSIKAKADYVRTHHLGGIIVWETAGTRKAGANRRLLGAVDEAVRDCVQGVRQ